MSEPRNQCFATILSVLLLALAGCAANPPPFTVPPVTAETTGDQLIGKFIWYDLITHDVAAAKRFYGQLFGWKFQDDPGGYTTVLNRGVNIGGIVYSERTDSKVTEARWIASLSVGDVDKAVEYVRGKGGVIYEGPGELPARGRFAIVSDPQGAMLALVRSSSGDPADGTPAFGDWLWNELWTDDIPAALVFYKNLAGYKVGKIKFDDGKPYFVLASADKLRAGVHMLPPGDIRAQWLPSVLVADPASIAAKTQSLGGELVLGPDDPRSDGTVAIILDPTGAALMVEKWPSGPQDTRISK